MLDLSALDDAALFNRMGQRETVATAPLSTFETDPDNPRFEDDAAAFEALVTDVNARGILQPIVVRRMPDGKLRIRFGERRYRAAVRLELARIPYVITEDPRQFDDYAQVAENAQRRELQPLELAIFIERKLAQGDTRRAVAAELQVDASAITHLLALAGSPPSMIMELYQSRRCRSPQYLYELRKLHEAAPALVTNCVSTALAVDRQLIEDVSARIRLAAGQGSVAGPANSIPAVSAGADRPTAGSGESCVAGKDGATRGRRRQANRVMLPVLRGCFEGRPLCVVLTRAPSHDGMLGVRFDGADVDEEVPIGEVTLTMLMYADVASDEGESIQTWHR
jgi:ParB family chromosome partitioning protein